MPKKLGDLGDFKPGKQKQTNKISDYREGRRFSFRKGGETPKTDTECGEIVVPDYNRKKSEDVGRDEGAAVVYDPTQLENYKKQYPRFERAIDLVADSYKKLDGKDVLLYCSDRSPTGYWQVEILYEQPTYYLEAGEPLQIICPVPYKITQIDTDADELIWEQLEGGRLAVVDPDNAIEPTLYILDNIRDSRPIRFKISVKKKPSVNDELIIYTTPTSTFDGLSFERAIASPDSAPCRAVPNTLRPSAPLPQYLQRGYFTEPGTYTFTWDLPICETQFLVETIWQQNTTGQYLDVQRFPVSSNRVFVAQLNTHYRVLSVFNTYGRFSTKDSQRFYFTSGNRLVIADDNFNGISFSQSKSVKTILPLNRIKLNIVDKLDGISFSQTKSVKTILPLSRIGLQVPNDTYNGLSFSTVKSVIQKVNLGGMIIR